MTYGNASHDAHELDDLRARVDCRTVLEQAGWKLDTQESTRGAAKYRAGAGQIVIVTHQGKGWFDPLNDKRGDVLALAQHVWVAAWAMHGRRCGHWLDSRRDCCR